MRVEKTITESLTRLPYIDYFKKTAGRLMKQDMISPVVLSLDISNLNFIIRCMGMKRAISLLNDVYINIAI